MMRILLLLFLSILAYPLSAQQFSVSGKVEDAQTKEVLPGAIVLYGKNEGAIADGEGRYTIMLSAGSYTLTFQYMGYESISKTIDLKADIVLDIALVAVSEELNAVVVVSAGKHEQRMEEVTVSIDVLKPDLIENKNAITADVIVNQNPGVAMVDDQVNIRGGSGWSYGTGSRVLVLVDDMPLVSADAGQVQWRMIPMENIEQVEVIKGAASALYGSYAMNGIINMRTSYPKGKPETYVNLYQGLYGDPKDSRNKWWDGARGFTGMNAMHKRSTGNVDWVAGLFLLKDQGYQYLGENTRARFNLNTTVRSKKISGLTYGVNVNMLYSDFGEAIIWESDTNGYVPFDSSATFTESFDFYIDPHITYRTERSKHRFLGRVFSLNNNAASEQTSYDNSSMVYYGEYQFQHNPNENLTLTGGVLNIYSYSNSDVFQGEHSSNNFAVYGQGDLKKGRWNLSLGVRFEDFRLDDYKSSVPVVRAGFNYEVQKGTYLRGSFGQGYRFPSMAEKYTLTNVGAIFVYPNYDLLPESGWSAELGIKQGVKIGEWMGFVDLAAFWMRYNNMMEFTFARWNASVNSEEFFGMGFKSVNVGETEITGAETTLIGTGKIGKAKLTITAGYTYMNPKILNPDEVYANAYNFPVDYISKEITYKNSSSDTSGILKYRYNHLAKADVQSDWKRFYAGGSVRYNSFMKNIDAIFETELFAQAIPGIKESRERNNDGDLIFDFRIGYRFTENISLAFIADNAFNEEYNPRPAQLGAPRTFTLQFKARL
jgi:outer membrane receptor for ferrienterochelin and colicins